MLHPCLDVRSQDAASKDFHLDTVQVPCNQAESRKVICNEGIGTIYRTHGEIYLHVADRQKKGRSVWG